MYFFIEILYSIFRYVFISLLSKIGNTIVDIMDIIIASDSLHNITEVKEIVIFINNTPKKIFLCTFLLDVLFKKANTTLTNMQMEKDINAII